VSNLFDTMAAAHAEIGDFKRAVEHQRRALSILEAGRAIFGADGPDDERREKIAKAVADFDARMQLYRTGQPYRQQ
jgi:hypothetical protein